MPGLFVLPPGMVLGWGCRYWLLCLGARGGRACRWCQDSISITTSSWPVSQWRWQRQRALSWLVTLVSLPFLVTLFPLLHVSHPLSPLALEGARAPRA